MTHISMEILYEECKHNVQDTVNLFGKLRFLPHSEKSVFYPTQKITLPLKRLSKSIWDAKSCQLKQITQF